MSFQSLYRKYRPQRFAELVGQEHVSTALRNAVREGRVGHAYLFSGPRGTGKTTTARILAKVLNCAAPLPEGEPCGECDSCVEIARGTSLDVIEQDAASNNKVEDMRELLARVAYRSAGGRRKVYILDEVHMLTAGAEAALLKTLEEPPEHVVFVLATTDPQKVAPTIRSRTQHFEFTLLTTEQIADHLAEVMERETVAAERAALETVARRAQGSVRDALSLLDQAVAHGDGRVDGDVVRRLFETTPRSGQVEIIDRVVAEDAAGALAALQTVLAGGADARQAADDLLRYLRNVFLASAGKGQVRVDVPDEEVATLVAHGEALGYRGVVRAVETLGEAAADIRRGVPDARLVLEVALVRLARREVGTRIEVLADRVERLERALDELRGRQAPQAPQASPPPAAASGPPPPTAALRPALGKVREAGAATSAAAGPPPPAAAPAPEPPAATTAPAPDPAPSAEPLDLDDVILAWPQVLQALPARLRAMAREAQPVSVQGASVVLGLPVEFRKSHAQAIEQGADQVVAALSSALGRPVRIRLTVHEGFLAAAPPEASAGVPPDVVDVDDVGEPVPDDSAVDSAGQSVERRLVDAFGATVEGEIARE